MVGIKKFNLKTNLPCIFIVVVVVALLACVAKILIWEQNYYASKEGSERAVVITSPVTEATVDETEISEQAITSYVVALDRPRYISIPKLGVRNARVLPISLTGSGQLGTPSGIFDAGWYVNSSRPGQGGTMLIDGHNGGPTKTGIFKHLPSLVEGDLIMIERGDGIVFTYQVVDNNTYILDEANAKMAQMTTSPVPGTESISIITCTGEWSQVQNTYLSRQFLRAILVNAE